jgi:putative ABC transport system ATP-binding protein
MNNQSISQILASEEPATNNQHYAANVPTIRLQQLARRYGHGESEVVALDNIDFTVQQGEFVALMGPSGAGKSTCLNILGCLDRPNNGHYFFQGVDVAYLSREQRALLRRHFIGFVFQGFNLLNRTTALENVELPLIYRRVPAKERHRRAREALAKVGLSGREKHTPGELSGGQQQRVAIARAIVTDPDLVLADEPTGNLDSAMSQEILRLLTHLNQEQGLTIVMVTHESAIAAFAQREVHFLDGRIATDTRRSRQAA